MNGSQAEAPIAVLVEMIAINKTGEEEEEEPGQGKEVRYINFKLHFFLIVLPSTCLKTHCPSHDPAGPPSRDPLPSASSSRNSSKRFDYQNQSSQQYKSYHRHPYLDSRYSGSSEQQRIYPEEYRRGHYDQEMPYAAGYDSYRQHSFNRHPYHHQQLQPSVRYEPSSYPDTRAWDERRKPGQSSWERREHDSSNWRSATYDQQQSGRYHQRPEQQQEGRYHQGPEQQLGGRYHQGPEQQQQGLRYHQGPEQQQQQQSGRYYQGPPQQPQSGRDYHQEPRQQHHQRGHYY